jgi:uncharacterized protein
VKNALIIFVRNPELGKVKTRLAATMGEEKALQIYKELLKHTFTITNTIAANKYVFYFDTIKEFDLWSEEGYFKRLQAGSDLGRKMKSAFEELFAEGYVKVVIIGSDCFELTTGIIEEAFYKLAHYDMVIGPANDGGYYLMGMKKIHPLIFENKTWSSRMVYSATLDDFEKNNILYYELPMLTDVDTEADWVASKKPIP